MGANHEMAETVGDGSKIKGVLEEIFDLMDKNKDGKIDDEEGKAVGIAIGESEEKAAQSWVGITNDMDADGNKVVDKAEWVGFYTKTLTNAPLDVVTDKLTQMKEKMAAGTKPADLPAPDEAMKAAVADAPAAPEDAAAEAAVEAALLNQAFVFIKPHAQTEAVQKCVKEGLEAKGITITSEGEIKSEVISEKKLIDQHYYAIASKATILKPAELNVPADKFEEQFGLTWAKALEDGNVYNAMDACEKLGITADELDTQWGICKKDKKLVKFGGGFYCGLIEMEGKDPIYAFNGFFMSMREKFCAPGLSIYYYTVEWDPAKLSWEDFRGKVLGPTDPAEAPADSLRGQVLAKWKELGLKSEPNVGDNGVHASASPFEAFAERNNWMGVPVPKDSFGRLIVSSRIPIKTIKSWSVDPQVTTEEGKKGSIFDALEDMDADQCLAKLSGLWKLNKPPAKNSAFVFIKPHAVTDDVKKLVKAGLEAKGLKILKEGRIKGEVIDKKKLIDQHYYAIASKATILKPDQLNVPEDKFKGKFGLEWKDALASGKVFNAMDGCAKLGIDADALDKEWAKAKKADKLIKFGGGFYCGLIEIPGKDPVYIFNGFFMSMRSKFTQPGTEIYYYSVEWDASALSWADFRGTLLGPTDPAETP